MSTISTDGRGLLDLHRAARRDHPVLARAQVEHGYGTGREGVGRVDRKRGPRPACERLGPREGMRLAQEPPHLGRPVAAEQRLRARRRGIEPEHPRRHHVARPPRQPRHRRLHERGRQDHAAQPGRPLGRGQQRRAGRRTTSRAGKNGRSAGSRARTAGNEIGVVVAWPGRIADGNRIDARRRRRPQRTEQLVATVHPRQQHECAGRHGVDHARRSVLLPLSSSCQIKSARRLRALGPAMNHRSIKLRPPSGGEALRTRYGIG